MKRKRTILFLLAACLLAGCGQEESLADSIADTTTATTAVTTERATQTAHTTTATSTTNTDTTTTATTLSTTITTAVTTAATTAPVSVPVPAETAAPSNPSVDESPSQAIDFVTDNTAPIILNGGYKTTIVRGTAFDLNQYVGYGDDYDDNPALTYTGQVNTAVCGSYPLTATVTDASGNATSWDLTVSVVDTLPSTPDTAARLQFSDFAAQYGGAGKELGIDVSKWQGEIDFQAVKNAGCSFVILRIGHDRNGIEMDEYYQTNMAAAKAAGLKVGVYFYFTANNTDTVREEAAWIAQQLGGQALDFPVVFDWESFTNYQKYGMCLRDLNALYEFFDAEMRQYGYATMLYGSKNYLTNVWTQTSHPVWLAHYTSATNYTGSYAMWQMSCRGRIDGIAGDVDLDILYTDVPLF